MELGPWWANDYPGTVLKTWLRISIRFDVSGRSLAMRDNRSRDLAEMPVLRIVGNISPRRMRKNLTSENTSSKHYNDSLRGTRSTSPEMGEAAEAPVTIPEELTEVSGTARSCDVPDTSYLNISPSRLIWRNYHLAPESNLQNGEGLSACMPYNKWPFLITDILRLITVHRGRRAFLGWWFG